MSFRRCSLRCKTAKQIALPHTSRILNGKPWILYFLEIILAMGFGQTMTFCKRPFSVYHQLLEKICMSHWTYCMLYTVWRSETQTMKMNFEQESSYFEALDTHSFLPALVDSRIDTDLKFLSKTWFLRSIIIMKVSEYLINSEFQLKTTVP